MSFCGWVLRVPYIFWILDSYQTRDLQYFLAVGGFSVFLIVSFETKKIHFEGIQFIRLSWLVLLVSVTSKNPLPDRGQGDLPVLSSESSTALALTLDPF